MKKNILDEKIRERIELVETNVEDRELIKMILKMNLLIVQALSLPKLIVKIPEETDIDIK